jgi:hypothetical protein
MDKSMFNLHLKECEFRFNNRKQSFIKIYLKCLEKSRLSCHDPKYIHISNFL